MGIFLYRRNQKISITAHIYKEDILLYAIKRKMYSIVIPVYNSENSLRELYERISHTFTDDLKTDYEIIFVDDSSKDNSYRVLKELKKQDSEHIRLLQLARNYGQHCALLCGFHYVQGDYIVTLDDDLQHPPEEIPKLIKKMSEDEENIDVVMGCYREKKHSFIRNLGTYAIKRVSDYIFKQPKDFSFTSFRLMKKYVVEAMVEDFEVRYPRVGYLLLDVTNKIVNVTVEHSSRKYGTSGYSFSMLVRSFCKNITNNSMLPLLAVQNMGMLSTLLSILLAIYYLYKYMYVGVSITGWTTLVLLMLLFSGLILFSIGIIGHYLIQILDEAKRKPNYVIRAKEL